MSTAKKSPRSRHHVTLVQHHKVLARMQAAEQERDALRERMQQVLAEKGYDSLSPALLNGLCGWIDRPVAEIIESIDHLLYMATVLAGLSDGLTADECGHLQTLFFLKRALAEAEKAPAVKLQRVA